MAMLSLFRRLLGKSSAARVQVELPSEYGAETLYDLAEGIAYGRDQPPLTRDLIRRFGGKGFLFNLRMWEAATRRGPMCGYVAADNYYRKRYETLTLTGVALRGSDVPLEMRFQALPMATLRDAAKELGAETFRDKKTGARLVAACGGAEAWLAARYALDGFFLLRPEPWSYLELEKLWHTYEEEAHETWRAHREPDD